MTRRPRRPAGGNALASGAVTLMVASTGGHLKELYCLTRRLTPPADDVVWVTNDSLQSRSLLAGQRTILVPLQGSRNLGVTLRNLRRAASVLELYRPARVVSTGAGIALSFLPLARSRGAECHYIESGTRVRGPSLTGKVLRWVPGVRCYTQHRYWADRTWRYSGSVLDGFRPVDAPRATPSIRRVAVVLGTWKQAFSSLVQSLLAILPASVESVWQTGFTNVDGMGLTARQWLRPEELAEWLREADVLVTHAGMGTVLDALEAGRCPVVVPRRRSAGEQIDNHQLELAAELDRRGLAVARLPEQLEWEDLVAAAGRRVETAPVESLPPFYLEG